MQPSLSIPDDVLRQIAPGGKIRLAVNLANASVARESVPGQFEGPAVDVANQLEQRLGIVTDIRPFTSGGDILAHPEAWDLAVLAVDPDRVHLRYLVEVVSVCASLAGQKDDPAVSCRDADREGCLIATAKGAAYEGHLLRCLSHARVVPHVTPAEARQAMMSGDCDFVAGIRSTLEQHFANQSKFRLLDDNFLILRQALAIPAQHQAAGDFLAHQFGAFGAPQ